LNVAEPNDGASGKLRGASQTGVFSKNHKIYFRKLPAKPPELPRATRRSESPKNTRRPRCFALISGDPRLPMVINR